MYVFLGMYVYFVCLYVYACMYIINYLFMQPMCTEKMDMNKDLFTFSYHDLYETIC